MTHEKYQEGKAIMDLRRYYSYAATKFKVKRFFHAVSLMLYV